MKRILLLIAAIVFTLNLSAATQSGKYVKVPHHKSKNVILAGKAKRVSLGDPEVLDIVMLRSNEVFLIGKKLGSTNLMAWDSRGRLIESIDVEVTHDLNGVKSKLYEFLPNETIEVHSSQEKLILSGQVSSQEVMNRAVKVAETFTAGEAADAGTSSSDAVVDETKVINLMSIGGAQQVMLEVTVAEVQRSLVRRFDSDFHFFNQNGNFGWGATSGGAIIDDVGGGIGPIFGSPSIDETGLLATFLDGNTLFTLALDIAKENGVAKVLAEPNLTALSGSKAEFLAGGEFPIPVPNRDGITVEYKEYGVGLKFVPTILTDQKINLVLSVDVSEIANSGSLTLDPIETNATYVIPPITKRTAASTLELADGQTIGIAGLLSENVRDVSSKMPGVGEIPVLGQLFNSQEFISGETELVILVTPRLARPIDRSKVVLPTDAFVKPNDWEFYLLGKGSYIADMDEATTAYEPANQQEIPSTQGGSEGSFGHDL
ncbi:type II and III secretion system protein family protein [Vibrio mediterranei]|jgi:pilus assembly protein CpaC|uniref:Type II and III secretion system protein family protein n=1 Tax=Vibrio barjaei TaxID=1676683 RepID=A0ABW7IHH9_9VIBR|nr:type II and III secretion system protein family protein [Vibrio barjaei]MCG9787132.1 type II and III secretion system protein family protein [Vibrio mediterranei]OIN25708.1 pilus assembly protein CpaC [Vibrio barjaei]